MERGKHCDKDKSGEVDEEKAKLRMIDANSMQCGTVQIDPNLLPTGLEPPFRKGGT